MKKLDKNKILRELAAFYQVTLILDPEHWEHGSVDLISDKIFINNHHRTPLSFLLSSFFHEYAHLICKYSNKYPIYHSDTATIPRHKQKEFLKTIWRAELFVDQMAEKLMKTHFNNTFKFHRSYNTKKQKLSLRPLIVEDYRKHFQEVNKS